MPGEGDGVKVRSVSSPSVFPSISYRIIHASELAICLQPAEVDGSFRPEMYKSVNFLPNWGYPQKVCLFSPLELDCLNYCKLDGQKFN